jgi:hypothetical protein
VARHGADGRRLTLPFLNEERQHEMRRGEARFLYEASNVGRTPVPARAR